MGLTVRRHEGSYTPAPIPVSALIDKAHLDMICDDPLQGRPLVNVTKAELMAALKREARVSNDGLCLGSFNDAVYREARMDSRLPIREHLEIMRRGVRGCVRGQE